MIHFRNLGHLPLLAATTLGISAKDDDSPIGQFGTGLKYTIAGILRLGGSITISIGDESYSFTSREELVRGKPFGIVQMHKASDGTSYPLGFTTDLGKHWDAWMYVRELWSNCRDEDGTHGYGPIGCGPDETVILVKCPAFEEAYGKLDEFILTSKPIHSGQGMNIHEGESPYIFFRGIRVFTLRGPSLFTYNITGPMHLTEDRTITSIYDVGGRFTDMVLNLKNELLLRAIFARLRPMSEGMTTIEAEMFQPLSRFAEGSFVFNQVVEEIHKAKPYDLHKAIQAWADHKFGEDVSGEHREPTPVERMKIEQALAACKEIGLDIQFPRVSKKPDEQLLGYAKRDHIYITERALRDGVSCLVATLIEEHLHEAESLGDYTRGFQDRLLRLLVNLYEERVLGAPLGGSLPRTSIAGGARRGPPFEEGLTALEMMQLPPNKITKDDIPF